MPFTVVTYNILSSELSPPHVYAHSDASDLDPETRIARVETKLLPLLQAGAIVCLQEVSHAFRSELTVFFARHGYHSAFRNYGGSFNGFMGVAIAWPTALELTGLELIVPSVHVPKAPKQADQPRSLLSALWSALLGLPAALLPPAVALLPGLLWQGALAAVRVIKPPPATPASGAGREMDEWKLARKAWNVALAARFRTAADRELVVATYHMPCKFWQPAMMSISACILADRVHRFADRGRIPYVIAGDFNLKPQSGPYKLLTTGALSAAAGDEAVPRARPGVEWDTRLPTPLTSAAATVLGREPYATNHARTHFPWSAGSEPFTDTLDYIFLSPGLRALGFGDLPDKDFFDRTPSLPCADEPSDHLLVSATVDFD